MSMALQYEMWINCSTITYMPMDLQYYMFLIHATHLLPTYLPILHSYECLMHVAIFHVIPYHIPIVIEMILYI
jgi:hypothetical protein